MSCDVPSIAEGDTHRNDGKSGGDQRGGEDEERICRGPDRGAEMGLERMVSMVPRSFSPAVRSMAGYMPPVMQSRMTM